MNWWLRWAKAIVLEEACNEAFEFMSVWCVRTLFLWGEISSLIRAHLLRVFSLLQKRTNTNKKHIHGKEGGTRRREEKMEGGKNQSRAGEFWGGCYGVGGLGGGVLGVHPDWLMSCWRIIPHMSEWRKRASWKRGRLSGMKSAGVATTT